MARRTTFVMAAVAGLAVSGLTTPATANTPAETPSTTSALTSIAEHFAAANKKKTKRAVLVSTADTDVEQGGKVVLHAAVSPAKAEKLQFQRRGASGGWSKISTAKTSRKGHAKTTWRPGDSGIFKVRAKAGKTTSKAVSVTVEAAPTPGPVPPPPPNPTTVSATWPSTTPLEVDKSYKVTAQLTPATEAAIAIQQKVGGDWQDLPGGSGVTDAQGAADLQLNVPNAGTSTFRVSILGTADATAAQDLVFSDAGDALYNVPLELPSEPGVIVKSQEFPMTYPKLPIKNPLKPTDDLIVPQIGTPAAGPPTCVTDPAIPRADCKIPGKQYRVMYTDKRWVPDSDGGGTVANGTVAATALVMIPDNVAADAPVVAWAHPTIGQANQCSISRGTAPIPMGDGTMGPGGMDINLFDVSFYLNQMLEKGYVVVMPDYLGIAVNGRTGQQKTYILGPQEARDLFYAVKALQTPAKQGWPGVTTGKDFVAAGHSQGGHAAMWAGIEADKLEPETGLKLKGVTAIAPATDVNQIVNSQWDGQVNWVLGPEVIQTYLGYMPQFAMQNNVLTPTGMQNFADLTELCTTQALIATNKFYPPGQPGTPFMQDPTDPKYQAAYLKWGRLLGAMTPSIKQGNPNSYPKDLPLTLISGTGDDIVISQVNAAMQESFCAGGANMRAFWTPVATGVANPPTATKPTASQAANHLNVLNFPFANDVSASGDAKPQIAAGALLEFTADRFAGATQTANCAQRQTTHEAKAPIGKVPSWYVFPKVDWDTGNFDPSKAEFYETGGSALLPKPTAANASPALGTVTMKTPPTQTGCGLQFKLKGLKYIENPDCVQWGLWPYGEFSYPDAKAGQTWGTYPLTFAAVDASAVSGASKLKVNVNPDRKSANYKVVVKRKKGSGWKSVKTTRTKGTKDVVTVNLKAGTYRVHLPAQHGQQNYRSAKVKLTR